MKLFVIRLNLGQRIPDYEEELFGFASRNSKGEGKFCLNLRHAKKFLTHETAELFCKRWAYPEDTPEVVEVDWVSVVNVFINPATDSLDID
jgi:hypothetical protein